MSTTIIKVGLVVLFLLYMYFMMGEYSNCPCDKYDNSQKNMQNAESFIAYPNIQIINRSPFSKYDYEKKKIDLGYNDYKDSSFRTDNKNIYQSGPYLNF
jgi:hypothetical protein